MTIATVVNVKRFIAWYDYDIKGYQDDRMDSELARVFEERVDSEHAILHSSQFGEYMAKPVAFAEETEWQRLAREKKAGVKIKEVRTVVLYSMYI